MLSKEEWQALTWFRTSQTGKEVVSFLQAKLAEARDVYENNPASETQRQLVLAYRKAITVLASVPLEDIA